MLKGFAPIVQKDAQILILGTMPSVKSLETNQYYGHTQNAFWKIIFSLWDQPLPDEYDKRTAFLKEKRIALWDVLASCEREGSADTAIRNPQVNDFQTLSKHCPNLKAIFFNSKNAEEFYKKYVRPDPFDALSKCTLPSTSPARAMQFEKKRMMWIPVKKAVEAGGQ